MTARRKIPLRFGCYLAKMDIVRLRQKLDLPLNNQHRIWNSGFAHLSKGLLYVKRKIREFIGWYSAWKWFERRRWPRSCRQRSGWTASPRSPRPACSCWARRATQAGGPQGQSHSCRPTNCEFGRAAFSSRPTCPHLSSQTHGCWFSWNHRPSDSWHLRKVNIFINCNI